MGSFRGRESSGAPGGYWQVSDEAIDENAVRQSTENSCGPACAEMLFRSRGIDSISQEMIIKEQGDDWSIPEKLAAAMNNLQRTKGINEHGKWLGAWVDTIHSPKETFESLVKRGSFITSLKSFGSESHMVVIDGIDAQDRISVRDPWEGTSYTITWEWFEKVWQGLSVWWTNRSDS